MTIRKHRVENYYVETPDRLIVTNKNAAHGAAKDTNAKVTKEAPAPGKHRSN